MTFYAKTNTLILQKEKEVGQTSIITLQADDFNGTLFISSHIRPGDGNPGFVMLMKSYSRRDAVYIPEWIGKKIDIYSITTTKSACNSSGLQ